MPSPQFYTETINQDYAKYIFSMSYADFKNEVYDKTELKDDGTKYNLQTYHHSVKKYLEKMIDSNYTNTLVNYKHSKNDIEGRSYVNGFGFQSLQKVLRGALCSHTIDYDMDNCHPAILLHVAKRTELSKCQYSYLTEYVENRKETLKNNDITKLDILINLNMDKPKSKNDFVTEFNKQLLKLKNTILEQDEYKHITTTNEKNPISSKVNKVLCKIESEILEKAIYTFQLKEVTKMFDGFMTTKTIDITDLNDLTIDYGIKWSIKPHNNDLQIEEYELKLTKKQKEIKKIEDKTIKLKEKKEQKEAKDAEKKADKQNKLEEKEAKKLIKIEEEKEATNKQTTQYETIKAEFEKNNYIVLNPVLYCKDFNNVDEDDITYPLKLMKEIYANVELEYIGDGGKVVKIPFINEWVKDPNRRQYDKRDFYPYNKNKCKCPQNTFNTFTPFKRLKAVENLPKLLNSDACDIIPDGCKFAEDLLYSILMGMCEQNAEAVNHVMLTIGHMIQYPEILQETILLFKGLPGIGKNTIFEMMKALLGSKYVHNDANIKNISGDFNGLIEGKLFIMIDEVAGTEFITHKDKIKALSTSSVQTINKKGVSQYKVNHYATLMLASNQEKPVTIDNKDRRYFINQGDFKNIMEGKAEELFNPFYAGLKNENTMNEVFHYFNEMDLTEFNPRKMPMTRAKKDLEEDNIKPVYRYLYDVLRKEELNYIFTENKKDENLIYVDKKELRNSINDYLDNMGITYTLTEDGLRKQLAGLGTCVNTSKSIKIKGKVLRKVFINKLDMIAVLKARFFNDKDEAEIEEVELKEHIEMVEEY